MGTVVDKDFFVTVRARFSLMRKQTRFWQFPSIREADG